MKQQTFENLQHFFDKVKSVGFFERLFAWKNLVGLSYDAYEEFKSVDKTLETTNEQLSTANSKVKELEKDLEHQKEIRQKAEQDLATEKKTIEQNNKEIQQKEKELGKLKESEDKNSKRITELEKDLEILKSKHEDITSKYNGAEKELAKIRKVEEQKQKEYDAKVEKVNNLHDQLEKDRLQVQKDRENEIAEQFEKMKETWRVHEDKVEEQIKNISRKHMIEYIDKENVPFKGKPDNTLKIAGEYIIFDAKSPQSDDLDNFPNYIKSQTESVKKYIKEKEVKKEIFLVVPTNTLEHINQLYYNMADYNVCVVAIDSLEPIIMSLKKIEEYDFAEQLSPDERDNICRVIGKFAHTTKRRVQIDAYFAKEFITLYSQCNTLPTEIREKAVQFEKSDKLNPPMEKRVKIIQESELKREVDLVEHEAKSKDINMDENIEKIEEIPLYTVKKKKRGRKNV